MKPDDAIWQTDLWGTREAAWERCATEAGRRHGVATYWRGDGTLLARSEYFHGVEHGVRERFHESGELAQRGQIADGVRTGRHESFRSISASSERVMEGIHDSIWRFENDYEDDEVVHYTRYFDRDGRRVDRTGERLPELPAGVAATAIYQHGAWIDGRIVRGRWSGAVRRWTGGGVLIEEATFRDGRRTGAFTRWTRRGVVVERGTYIGGRIKDHWLAWPTPVPTNAVAESGNELHWVLDGSRWNDEGRLIEHRNVVDGVLHGEALAWNADGVLIARSHYANGLLDGTAERFFADGTLMSSVTYVAGVETGTRVLVRRPDEEPSDFPICNPRIVCVEQTGATVRLFDAFGVECTADGIPESLWRARSPARAAWRDAVRAYEWPDVALPRALLELVAEDDGLRHRGREALRQRCAEERDPASPDVLAFVIRLVGIAGTRERAALVELLCACGEATDLAPATATFIALLDDPDAAVRTRTTTVLAQLRAGDPLRAALARETDVAVRASCYIALGALGEAVAAGLIASEPIERLGAALGIAAARGAKSPASVTAALVAALAEPEPLPWAHGNLVTQACEALRRTGKPRAVSALIAALPNATRRSAPLLCEALLALGGDVAAIADCDAAWEDGSVRELLRQRDLPYERDALRAKPKRKRKRKDA